MESRIRCILVLVWIIQLSPLCLSGTVKPLPPGPITRIVDARRSAAPAHPAAVRLRGVITAFSGWHNSFFLQDATGGISVDRQEPTDVRVGQNVEVAGTVRPGFFAPVILSDHIDILGNQRPPPPLRPDYQGLARGQLDSQWIEISGVIHSAQVSSIWGRKVLKLDLHMEGGNLTVQVLDFPAQSFEYLVDSVVSIQGVCGTIFNDRRQLVGLRLFTPRLDKVTIKAPARAIAEIPPSAVQSLLAFSPRPQLEHRVKIVGTVTYQNLGSILYIQDKDAGVLVRTAQTEQFPIGTRVEAVGFVAADGYSPSLREATVRSLGPGVAPPPVPVSAASVITSENGFAFAPRDGTLVQIEAQVVDRPPPVENQVWLLRDGPVVFQAHMIHPLNGHRLGIGPGNDVRVTGICVVEAGEGHNPESFRLLIRSPRDFVVVRTPFWAVSRLFLATAFLILASLMLLGWGFRAQLSKSGAGVQDFHSPALTRGFARAARLAGMTVWFIALTDLLGWAFHVEVLKRVLNGYVAMMPNSALSFLLASFGFLPLRLPSRFRSVFEQLCAGIVILIAVLTLLEYLTGQNLYLDGFLIGQFSDRGAQGEPLRMAFVSAFAFLLLGCALLLDRKPFVLVAQWFAIGSGVACILNLVGYIYGLQNGEVNSYSFMAAHTALCFLLLSLAVLFRKADCGVMAVMSSDALGGVMGRRLIPAALLLPAIIGWLRWQGELSGLYDTVFGLAIFVAAIMAAFAFLIWASAILLNRLDAARFQTERELRLLVEGTSDYAIFMLDPEGNIATWNDGAERIKGYAARQVIGRHFSYLYDVDEIPSEDVRLQTDHALRVAAAEGRFEEEAWQVRRDHSRFWAHVVITALRSKNGELRGFSNVTRDATELKKATEDLVAACKRAEDANRAKSDFLATMSHEIRTPMNAILGMTDLVMETGLNAVQRDYVERCRRAGANLLNLINDILDLSKIESSRFELEQIPFSLAELVARTAELIGPKAEIKGIALSTELLPETPPVLIGDPFRLQQLLINLLGNAVKFTEHGKITLVMGPQPGGVPGHLFFRVTDTGIGIRDDKLSVIFEDFTQAESSTTRRFGGSGLGLGISRRLANRMGGELTASSIWGQGSTFLFDAKFTVSEESLPAEPPIPAHQLVGRRVLVIDANATSRLITSNMCFGWGMIPIEADSHSAALDLVQDEVLDHRPFSLLIMDVVTPGANGFDSFLKLRSLCPEMPIIMTSSDSLPGEATRAKALGASAYALKPLRSADLFRLVSASIKSEREEECHLAATASDESGIPKILVAEDSEDNRFLLEAYFSDQPYSVTYVQSGEEAVFAFQQDIFGLILMDVQMPVMDGLRATELIREIERKSARSRTPILALTANAFLSDRELSRAAGCDGHLSKPISRETLISAVKASVLTIHSPEPVRQHS
jgi:PAS domain S-box-containing protein